MPSMATSRAVPFGGVAVLPAAVVSCGNGDSGGSNARPAPTGGEAGADGQAGASG
jgi:hypothetical protein